MGRSPYTHAGLAYWSNVGQDGNNGTKVLNCCEVRELIGGRTSRLADQVARAPGRIDVYRPATKIVHGDLSMAVDRGEVVNHMLQLAEPDHYGWQDCWSAYLLHSGIGRWLGMRSMHAVIDDARDIDGPLTCSGAVSAAFRMAGLDLVPNLADQFTEPADLSRSGLLRYLFTLEMD